MGVEISTIIPVYNAIRTLPECIGSYLQQTALQQIKTELLLIDDASDDGTTELCKTYEKSYPNIIRTITLSENHGPGYARNIGLSEAKGRFVSFLDADDAIVPTMLELLYQSITSTNADFADGGFYFQKNDTAIVYTSDDLTGEQTPEKRSTLIVSGGYTVTKIFRLSFLKENAIRFREEYVLEDMDFLTEVYAKASCVSNVKEILYIYRDSADSLSKVTDTEKYYHATTTAMQAIYDKTHLLPYYEDIRDAVEYAILQLYSYAINICLKTYLETSNRTEILPRLLLLQKMKRGYVYGDYENAYVQAKISKKDIDIMRQNDLSPENLLSPYSFN